MTIVMMVMGMNLPKSLGSMLVGSNASATTQYAVGGLYQPLGAKELQARGLLLDDADPGLDAADNDRVDQERFAAALQAAAGAAERAVAEIRAGRLEPRPATCGWRGGGCTYPSICRCTGT